MPVIFRSSVRNEAKAIARETEGKSKEVAGLFVKITATLSTSAKDLKEYSDAVKAAITGAFDEHVYVLHTESDISYGSDTYRDFEAKAKNLYELKKAQPPDEKAIAEAMRSISESYSSLYPSWEKFKDLEAEKEHTQGLLDLLDQFPGLNNDKLNEAIEKGDKLAKEKIEKDASSYNPLVQQDFIDSLYDKMKEGKKEVDKFNGGGTEVRKLEDIVYEISQYKRKVRISTSRSLKDRAAFNLSQKVGAKSIDAQYEKILDLVGGIDFEKMSGEITNTEANIVMIKEYEAAFDRMRNRGASAGKDFLKSLGIGDLKKVGLSKIFDAAKTQRSGKLIDTNTWFVEMNTYWLNVQNLNDRDREQVDRAFKSINDALEFGRTTREDAAVQTWVLLNTFYINNSGIVYDESKKQDLIDETNRINTIPNYDKKIKAIETLWREEVAIYAREFKDDLKNIFTSSSSKSLLAFLGKRDDDKDFTNPKWDDQWNEVGEMYRQLANRLKPQPSGPQKPTPPSSL